MTGVANVFVLCLAFAFNSVIGDDDHGSHAVTLTKENFTDQVNSKPHFVMFFAPWCGHCKRLAPKWDELAEKFNKDLEKTEVVIGKVDCTQNTEVCADNNVKGYPTLLLFNEKYPDGEKFSGKREVENFEKFINEHMAEEDKSVEEEEEEEEQVDQKLVDLDSDTFDKRIKKGNHFVKFFAPWCGHCRKLAPAWDQLAETFKDNKDVSIARIDCVQHQQPCRNQDIRGYPTLHWFANGERLDTYRGGRSHEELVKYVETMLTTVKAKKESTEEKIPKQAEVTQDDSKNKDSEDTDTNVVVMSDASFADDISSGYTFVKFYAPWCGFCKKIAPTWEELASKFSQYANVKIAKIDCTVHKDTCSKNQVRGYPTLTLFHNSEMVKEHQEGRDLETLSDFLKEHIGDEKPRDEL